MKSLLIYLLQMMAASGILYAYYHFFLRNKLFHQYNRFYLLAIVCISLVVPFFHIPVYFEHPSAGYTTVLKTWQTITDSQPAEQTFVTAPESRSDFQLTWQMATYLVYAVAAILLLIRFLISINKIRSLIRRHPREELNGIHFVNTEERGTPFSFFRWLFWHRQINLDSDKGQQIFRHEVFHIRQRHSADRLFMEAVTIICWFNPFYHLIAREMKVIHEFLADRFATTEETKWEYSELLLMQALNTQHRLTNPFFHNQIKRRIAMIMKTQKTSHQYLRKLLVLPVAALLVVSFAFRYKHVPDVTQATGQTIENGSPRVLPDTSKSFLKALWNVDLSIDKLTVEEPGYDDSNRNIVPGLIVMNNMQYLTAEFKKRLTGAQRIEMKSLHAIPANNEKAIKKYGESARDGVIEINDVIMVKPWGVETHRSKLTGRNTSSDPLYVIDGKIIEKNSDFNLNQIDPNNIESVSVLKDQKAIEKYGDKGKFGVLEINQKVEGQLIVENKATISPANVTFQKAEIEPAYPGGKGAWDKFVTENLNMAIPAINNAPEGNYTVFVEFVVEKDGSLRNFQSITNHGFGMEQETIRLIRQSGSWLPGIQNGQKVAAIKRQRVEFKIAPSKTISTVMLPEVVLVAYIDLDSKDVVVIGRKSGPEPNEAGVAWRKYLERNINSAIAVKEGFKPGKYQLPVQFTRSENGSISNVIPLTYSDSRIATQCASVVSNMSDLKPAKINNDGNVYIQPLTLVILDKDANEVIVEGKQVK